ncbi:MAG: hypothetical protein KDC43_11915 [Saprospiraceae bacterium]|nr:hypothetical protein [Saprospiraceae bacterium]MCB0624591.1 hypothetical protein [Saprospiraceae bacterium]MCB0677715.1 hypothetical protein [Saprospiraceae bacterium]MCB0683749.1 hypothetical protein [Saprospiraceae bacterium]
MNRTILNALLIGLALLLTSNALQAQKLSKEEEKKWEKEAKKYKKNPAALKKLVEGQGEYKDQVNDLEAQLASTNTQLATKDDRISSLEDEVMNLELQLSAARQSIEDMSQAPTLDDKDAIPMGIIYRVQIGAYEKDKHKLDSSMATNDMTLEQADNLQKIVLGQFRDYQKAVELRNRLKTMGVKDAWIVSYRDGVRISVEEATGKSK